MLDDIDEIGIVNIATREMTISPTSDLYGDYAFRRIAKFILSIYSMVYMPDAERHISRWGYQIICKDANQGVGRVIEKPDFDVVGSISISYPRRGKYSVYGHGSINAITYPHILMAVFEQNRKTGKFVISFFPSTLLLFHQFNKHGLERLAEATEHLHDKVSQVMKRKIRL